MVSEAAVTLKTLKTVHTVHQLNEKIEFWRNPAFLMSHFHPIRLKTPLKLPVPHFSKFPSITNHPRDTHMCSHSFLRARDLLSRFSLFTEFSRSSTCTVHLTLRYCCIFLAIFSSNFVCAASKCNFFKFFFAFFYFIRHKKKKIVSNSVWKKKNLFSSFLPFRERDVVYFTITKNK